MPLSETEFFLTSADSQMRFYQDEKGKVTHFTIQPAGGKETRANRVE